MYNLKFLSTVVGLASTAIAAPIVQRSIDGTNAGSIFRYGDPAAARLLFYVSGSCGLSTYFVGTVPDSMPLVAMPSTVMQQYGSSQYNTLCGKIITITNANGVSQQAAVADTNISNDNSIDMTSDLWVAFGQPADDGSVIPSLTWSIGALSASTTVDYNTFVANTDSTTAASATTVSSSATAVSTVSATCSKTHAVVAGDTCWAIWSANGLTESQLRTLNPGLNAACLIYVGEELCLA